MRRMLALFPIFLASSAVAVPQISYPKTERVEHVDTYHGVQVPDPYQWLEETDTLGSKVWPKVAAWIEAENKVTHAFLEGIPQRGAIKQRITELWNYERFGVPGKEGGHYFFTRNDGLQNQSVLLITPRIDVAPSVLLDPNTFSADGTVALGPTSPSRDGGYLAYAIADAGSDWNTWRVIDLASGKPTADELKWVKFTSASWDKENKGFYYNRYKEPPMGQSLKSADEPPALCYHLLGTAQDKDTVVWERPGERNWSFGAGVTDDGEFLVLSIGRTKDINNNVFYKDLRGGKTDGPVVELLKDWDAEYNFIDHDGPVFWFTTDGNAPRRRMIAIDITRPERSSWKEIIPQSDDAIQGVSVVGDHFIVQYLHDAHSLVKVVDVTGKPVRDVDLPGLGSVSGFQGKRNDPETFYSYTGFNQPATVYRLDVSTGKSTVFKKPSMKFDPDAYVTTQVFFSSKDGTRVPMFITHRKDVTPGRDVPTLLYGYGGFDISITPSFSPGVLVWMEMGGIFAVPNLRGGGEYGREWHVAGTKTSKQNVFNDFISAAEYLIENKYTSSKRLAISGASNGGLLVGACMTQRPELYGACLPAVGVMDMLRYTEFTTGRFWEPDYGSVAKPDEFKALLAYSPYHNIKKGTCYPPTLITTADHDDRVYPAHSFKFAAAAQEAQSCDNPVLIRIETRAGHGAGKPTAKRIEEIADQWAFLVKVLGLEPSLPGHAVPASR